MVREKQAIELRQMTVALLKLSNVFVVDSRWLSSLCLRIGGFSGLGGEGV